MLYIAISGLNYKNPNRVVQTYKNPNYLKLCSIVNKPSCKSIKPKPTDEIFAILIL